MQDRRLQSHGIVTPKEGNKAKEMETRGKVKRAKGISNIKVQMERGKGGVERIVAVFILVKWGGGAGSIVRSTCCSPEDGVQFSAPT